MSTTRRCFVRAVTALFVAGSLFTATDASAQRWKRYRKSTVDQTIRRCEASTDRFVELFDRQLDRSVLDDSAREDRLNDKAKDLERSLDRLREEFNRRESWWECREHVAEALQHARGINKSVRARRYSRNAESLWYRVRSDLNSLAGYYELPPLPR